MASALKPSHQETDLYARLLSYLNSDEIPTSKQEEFTTVNREYQDLTPIIMQQFENRQITTEFLSSLAKLQQLSFSLFRITKSNIEGWKTKTIEEGFDADTINAISQQVLAEYATRWGITQEEV